MMVGRSGCGRTTLTQVLRGNAINCYKTHDINHDCVIDTPGE